MALRDRLGCFVFSVGPGGIIRYSRDSPASQGKVFHDYCVDAESSARWQEAYKTCFAMREPQENVRVTVRMESGHVVNLVTDLVWHGNDEVMVYMQREWPEDLLTERERECLQLMAAGLDAKKMAMVMETTADNARATASRVKKKLELVYDEGLVVAAYRFRDKGNSGATDQT